MSLNLWFSSKLKSLQAAQIAVFKLSQMRFNHRIDDTKLVPSQMIASQTHLWSHIYIVSETYMNNMLPFSYTFVCKIFMVYWNEKLFYCMKIQIYAFYFCFFWTPFKSMQHYCIHKKISQVPVTCTKFMVEWEERWKISFGSIFFDYSCLKLFQ